MKNLYFMVLYLIPAALSAQTAQEWFDRALTVIVTERKYEEGIAHCNKALALDPNYAEAWNRRGYAYSLLENYQQAIDDYNKAIQLSPGLAKAYHNRAMAYYFLKKYAEAIPDFQKTLSLDPGMARVDFTERYAYSLYRQGRYAESLPLWDKAVVLDPQDAMNWLNRGYCREKSGQREGALQDYGESIRLKPDFALSYAYRADLLFSQERYKEAIPDYEAALRLAPGDYKHLLNLGEARYQTQAYASALDALNKYIEQNRQKPTAWNLRGLCKISLNQAAAAPADFSEAIQISPKEPIYYNNRGYALYLSGQYEQAIADYDKCMALMPPQMEPYFKYKSDALRKLSQAPGASAESLFNAAMAMDAREQYEEVLGLLNRCISLNPNEARFYYGRYTAQRKAVKAFATRSADLEKAISLDPNKADYHYWLGEEYFLSRRNEDAIREYDRCMALGGHYMLKENPRGLGDGNYKQVILNQRAGGVTQQKPADSPSAAQAGDRYALLAQMREFAAATRQEIRTRYGNSSLVLEEAEVTDYRRVTGGDLKQGEFLIIGVYSPTNSAVKVTMNRGSSGTTCTDISATPYPAVQEHNCSLINVEPITSFYSFTIERSYGVEPVYFVLFKGLRTP